MKRWAARFFASGLLSDKTRAQGAAMPQTYNLRVNGESREVSLEGDTPLLYVLKNDLELSGAKFGCGLAQCGACTVLMGGTAVRSCVTEVRSVGSRDIVTLEGIGTEEKPHPLQAAFIAEQAMQCGYCINGMIMSAKALLDRNPHPTDGQVREALAGNLCRCGSHNRIVRAILRASKENAT
jgi:nicotinate dehydrogenase subunit A